MTTFLSDIILHNENDIQFKNSAGNNAGKISQTGDDLVLSNAVGDILLGSGSDDVYIGDGTSSVDIRFEQNMAIFADSATTKTLTIGGANTDLILESPTISGSFTLGATTINNKLTFTTSSGYIIFDYETGETGEYASEVPLLQLDRSGSPVSILTRVTSGGAIVLGIDDTVHIAAGDTKSVIKSNVNYTAEQVIFSSESGFIAYGFPSNDTTWSNRNEFRFRSDSATAGDNGLYIGDGGNTQFIDVNRNLKNIGTISSGAITSTGQITGTELEGTSLDINGAADISGNLVVGGDLTVNGTTVTVDTTNLNVQDKNITLNYSTGDSSSTADGAGITIQDAVNSDTDATILWTAASDRFDFSHQINVTGAITSSGQITGTELEGTSLDINGAADISGTLTTHSTVNIGATQRLYLDGGSDTYITESSADIINFYTGGISRAYINSAGITSYSNVYSGTTGQFRNYAGTWKGTTGVSGNGFEFASADGTAMTLSSTGAAVFTGSVTGTTLTGTSLDINGASDFNSGTENLIATFTSTDSIGEIRIADSSAYSRILNVGTQLKLMPNDGVEVLVLDGNNSSATFAGSVTADTIVINDTDSTRGVFRNDAGYDLRLGGGTVYSDGAYISLSGGIRGGGTSNLKGRIEMRSGGSNYSAQADITGDIVIGTQWNGGSSDILTLDSSTNAATFEGKLQVNQQGNGTSNLPSPVAVLSGQNTASVVKALSLVNSVTAASGNGTQIAFHNASNYSPTGTITTIQDGDVVTDSKMEFQIYNGGLQTALTIDHDSNATFAGDVILSGTAPTLRIQDSRNLNNPDWDNVSLGNIEFYTSDTTSPGARVLAEIEAFSNATAASGPNADLIFKTSEQTDSSPQTRLTIGHNGVSTFTGNVTVGSNSLTAGSLDINGNADISGTAVITSQITAGYGVKFTNGSTDFLLYNNPGEDVLYMRDTTNGAMITHWGVNDFKVYKNLIGTSATFSGSVTVGQNDTGYDVKFFGATSGKYMLWDESADRLLITDNTYLALGTDSDFLAFHSGSNGFLSNYTGHYYITNNADNGNIYFQSDDGSGGVTPYLTLDGSATATVFNRSTKHSDSIVANFGTGNDLQIYHNATDSKIDNYTGDLYITNFADDKDIIFRSDDGAGGFETYFYLDGSASSGDPYTVWPDNSIAAWGTGADLRIQHDGSTASIFNTTGHLQIINYADDSDVIFKSDDGSGGVETYFFLDGSLNTDGTPKTVFPDNSKLQFGSGAADLRLWHDATDSHIVNNTGDLYITNNTDDKDIIFQSDDGSGGVESYFALDGGANANVSFKSIFMADNKRFYAGGGGDLGIYHDGTNNYIDNTNGDLYIRNTHDDKDIIFQCDDHSGGISTYFFLDGSTTSELTTTFPDNSMAAFGNGNDLRLWHDGSTSYINNYTGTFKFYQHVDDGDMIFYCDDGSGGATPYITLDGSEGHTVASKEINFSDGIPATFGNKAGGDLEIKEQSGNSYISNFTGNLEITNHTDDGDIIFKSDDGSGGVTTYLQLDGSSASVFVNRPTIFYDTLTIPSEIIHSGDTDTKIAFGTNTVTVTAGNVSNIEASATGASIPKRKFSKSGTTDGDHDGDIVYFGGTTSMEVGEIYYLTSSGTWALADADAESTAKGMLAVALGGSSDTDGMLVRGFVTLDHDPGTVGDTLFLSTTAGLATATAPSGNGDIVRVIGYCLDSTNGQIYFNPDGTFVEVSA